MQKLKAFLLVVAVAGLLAAATAPVAVAQKIGYTQVDLLVNLMPESEEAEKQLRMIEQKLSEALNVKKLYIEGKMSEYQEKAQKPGWPAEERAAAEQELVKLQEELQKAAQESEDKLVKKRSELYEPLLDRVQKGIDAVAEELGYTYVFNANTGGSSILLKGPVQDNLTLKILDKMGVTVPAEIREQLTNPKPGGGTVSPTPAPGNK